MLYKKFARDIAIMGCTNALITLRGLIVLPVVAKLLGTQYYGVWAQIMTAVSFAASIGTLGLPYSFVRFLSSEKNKNIIQDDVWSIFAVTSALSLALAAIILVFSGSLAAFWRTDFIVVVFFVLALVFECLNSVFLNVLRSFQRLKSYSSFIASQSIGEVGLVSMAIFLGFHLTGAVFSLFLIRAIIFLAMGARIVAELKITVPKFLRLREYFVFALPMVSSGLSSWVAQSSDRYLIGYFLGIVAVGYYAPGYLIAGMINLIVAPLTVILPAFLSNLYDQGEIGQVKQYLSYSLKYFLALAIPAVFGLSVLAKPLLNIFSNQEIANNGSAVVPVIALGFLLLSAYSIVSQVFVVTKKTNIVGFLWMMVAFVSGGFNLVLIPRIGIMGAALSVLISYAFTFAVCWFYANKNLSLRFNFIFVFKSVMVSALMALFIFWLHPAGLLATIGAVVLGATIYMVMLFLARGFNEKEIVLLKGLFSKKLQTH